MSNFRFTRNFSASEQEALGPKINLALEKFPELDDRVITVGRTTKAKGRADIYNGNYVWFRDTDVSFKTIGHELTHLLQDGSGIIPSGEVACDIWTLARDKLFLDSAPNYLLFRVSKGFESHTAMQFKNYQRNKKSASDEASIPAMDLSWHVFINNFNRFSYSVLRKEVIQNWDKYSEKFRDECIIAIDSRPLNPRTYIQNLCSKLASYCVRNCISAKAKSFEADGVELDILNAYKEHVEQNEPEEVLMAEVFGKSINQILGLDKLKIKTAPESIN